PAVVRRHVAHDRQSEAGATGVATASLVDAVEALEDARLLARRDADALVGDHQLGEAALHAGADLHATSVLGVLHGVLDQVAKGGDQLPTVAPDPALAAPVEHRDLDATRRGELAGTLHAFGDDVADRHRFGERRL